MRGNLEEPSDGMLGACKALSLKIGWRETDRHPVKTRRLGADLDLMGRTSKREHRSLGFTKAGWAMDSKSRT